MNTLNSPKKYYFLLPFVAFFLGFFSSCVVFFLIHLDFLLIDFVILVFLPFVLTTYLIIRKDPKMNMKLIIGICIVSVIVAFVIRIFADTFFLYHFHFSSLKDITALDAMLRSETGFDGFLGAFLWQLHHTQMISSPNIVYSIVLPYDAVRSNIVQVMQPWEVILGWALEFVAMIAIVITYIIVAINMRPRTCEKCGKIKQFTTFVVSPFDSWKTVQKALLAKNFTILRENYHPKQADKHNFTAISSYACEKCKGMVHFDLIASGTNIGTKPIGKVYDWEDYQALLRIFNAHHR